VNCTGTQGQQAYDFYVELKNKELSDDCCGPLVYLQLNTSAVERVFTALRAADMEDKLADAFICKAGEDTGRFGACIHHWFVIAALTMEIGSNNHRHDIEEVGKTIFRTACKMAGWDYKEVDNFLQNLVPEEE
jgi:hypothetical protein